MSGMVLSFEVTYHITSALGQKMVQIKDVLPKTKCLQRFFLLIRKKLESWAEIRQAVH
jgi:hypothetical protein